MGAPPMRRESHLRAPFRSRMASKVFFAHMNARNVRVYLRRSDVGMTEDFLDGAQIGTAFEHMGRKRVTQRMRMKALDACRPSPSSDDRMHALPRYPRSARVQKHRRIARRTTRQNGARFVEVASKGLRRHAPQGGDSLFRTLSSDAHEAFVEKHIAPVHTDELAYPQAATV